MMRRQRGVALLIVLLVVALATVIAMSMAERLQLNLQRSINIQDSQQAYWFGQGAENYARVALLEQIKQADGVIHGGQPWAQQGIRYPLPNGDIEARVTDLQSCFNLNALHNPDTVGTASSPALRDAFKRLLNAIEPPENGEKIPDYNADVLADSLLDWLDKDDTPSGYYGAESSEYESRTPAYRAANNLLVSKSELRIINGAEPAWIMQAMPFVCVIPDVDSLKINVNTLSEQTGGEILHALLGENFSLTDARALVSRRPADGYKDIQDFLSEAEIAALNLTDEQKGWFDITSSYFLLSSKTRYNDAQFAMTSLLFVEQAEQVKVLRREFGGPL